jgi:hypothetical protein
MSANTDVFNDNVRLFPRLLKFLATEQTQFSNSNSAPTAIYELGYLLRLWTTCPKKKKLNTL